MAKKLDREALCRELLTIEKKNSKDLARMTEIKSLLKGDDDSNFKIVVRGLGEVSVSVPKPERVTGTAPELSVENFLAMSETKRQQLVDRGLVSIVDVVKAAYYGGVTTKIYGDQP